MDFNELERMVDEIITPMHNGHLNELRAFATMNPSAENVAAHVAGELLGKLRGRGVFLMSVTVWETDDCRATCKPRRAPVATDAP
jgi:6-pyruvoyl-tetrahydropterin synthase